MKFLSVAQPFVAKCYMPVIIWVFNNQEVNSEIGNYRFKFKDSSRKFQPSNDNASTPAPTWAY